MAGLAEDQATLAREGIGLVAISVDPREESVELAAELGIEFPLAHDPGAQTAAAYGVKMEGETLAVPATFVVRADATIVWSYTGTTLYDRPGLDEVHARALAARSP